MTREPEAIKAFGLIKRERIVHLDALRGIAALLVVIGHTRGFILVDYAEAGSTQPLTQAIYFATGLGHSAVIAFFALSGFLVGGSAIDTLRSGKWSGPHFAIARLSRLWTVALPALALTWIVDNIGICLSGGAGYDGRYWNLLSSGPSALVPADLGALAFLGNAFFLQTITVSVLGSNGPLWSLANEFWYYVVFPAIAWVVFTPARLASRALMLLAAVIVAAVLPGPMIALGAIWVAGALGHSVYTWEPAARVFEHPVICVLLLGIVIATLIVPHSAIGLGLASDLVQGLAWTAALPALALARLPRGPVGRAYRRLSIGLSEISFTLYATHFPLLALAYFCFIAPKQMSPDITALTFGAGLLCAALAQGVALWWLFERHTDTVRRAGIRAFYWIHSTMLARDPVR